MNARIFDSADDLAAAAAETLLRHIRNVERPVVGISGGSSPEPFFRLLATPAYSEPLARHAITWVLVDERYVPIEDPQSNAASILRTLFSNGIAPSHRFLRFDTTHADVADCVRAFEAEWRTLDIDHLDVVFLGVGLDGHTASLFPETAALEADGIATSVFVPRLAQTRATLTKPVLRAATQRIVLAPGAAKAPVLAQIRSGERLPIVEVTEGLESWFFVERSAWQ
jgi:6-phosphogluconolactonase